MTLLVELEAIRIRRIEREARYWEAMAAGLVDAAAEHEEFEVALARYDRRFTDAELDRLERAREMAAECRTWEGGE